LRHGKKPIDAPQDGGDEHHPGDRAILDTVPREIVVGLDQVVVGFAVRHRMLKKPASFVLATLRTSTYGKEYASVLR
jgi:hypothetical protein